MSSIGGGNARHAERLGKGNDRGVDVSEVEIGKLSIAERDPKPTFRLSTLTLLSGSETLQIERLA